MRTSNIFHIIKNINIYCYNKDIVTVNEGHIVTLYMGDKVLKIKLYNNTIVVNGTILNIDDIEYLYDYIDIHVSMSEEPCTFTVEYPDATSIKMTPSRIFTKFRINMCIVVGEYPTKKSSNVFYNREFVEIGYKKLLFKKYIRGQIRCNIRNIGDYLYIVDNCMKIHKIRKSDIFYISSVSNNSTIKVIQGPPGPMGDKGKDGTDGTMSYIFKNIESIDKDIFFNEGDLVLFTNTGIVYKCTSKGYLEGHSDMATANCKLEPVIRLDIREIY